MPNDRYFADAPLEVGDTIRLEGPEAHHLTRVMRTRMGDIVEMINGCDVLAQVRLEGVDKRGVATLEVIERTVQIPVGLPLVLIQAIPRRNRLDTIVEKGTELGMTHLFLFASDRSELDDVSDSMLARVRAMAVSAIKQCGRLRLPEIVLLPAMEQWNLPSCQLFFGDVSPAALPLLKAVEPSQGGYGVVIGPESGLTAKEEATLRSLGATGVTLHTNILRTDTAAIAALAQLSTISP